MPPDHATPLPDNLADRIELRLAPDAPPGNVIVPLARLLRRLRDRARQRTLSLRPPDADQAGAEKAG